MYDLSIRQQKCHKKCGNFDVRYSFENTNDSKYLRYISTNFYITLLQMTPSNSQVYQIYVKFSFPFMYLTKLVNGLNKLVYY
jgi:hypothetical protein